MKTKTSTPTTNGDGLKVTRAGAREKTCIDSPELLQLHGLQAVPESLIANFLRFSHYIQLELPSGRHDEARAAARGPRSVDEYAAGVVLKSKTDLDMRAGHLKVSKRHFRVSPTSTPGPTPPAAAAPSSSPPPPAAPSPAVASSPEFHLYET